MTKHIRWTDDLGRGTGFTGCVGTLRSWLFQVWRDGDHWVLEARLPGVKRLPGDDPDVLKAEAERWLEEFTSSLGAVFPDEDDAVFDERPTGAAFEALYAPGRRVRFAHPDAGYPADQQMAASLLTPGEVYVIAWSDIGFASSRLGLAGVESRGQGFNSVLFEPVDDPSPSAPGGGGIKE